MQRLNVLAALVLPCCSIACSNGGDPDIKGTRIAQEPPDSKSMAVSHVPAGKRSSRLPADSSRDYFVVPFDFLVESPGNGYEFGFLKHVVVQGVKGRYYHCVKDGARSSILITAQEHVANSQQKRRTMLKALNNSLVQSLRGNGFADIRGTPPSLEFPIADRVRSFAHSKNEDGIEIHIHSLMVFGAKGIYSIQANAPTAQRANALFHFAETFRELEESTFNAQLHKGFLFRPVFETEVGGVNAGNAFSVHFPTPSRSIVLTALQLLGKAGGLDRDLPPAEIQSLLKDVKLIDRLDQANVIGIKNNLLPIKDTAPRNEPSRAGDVLAVCVPDDVTLPSLSLADVEPEVGDQVWLAGQFVSQESNDLRTAMVYKYDAGGNLMYAFKDSHVDLHATSGAPVFDREGRVVAIHIGGGTDGEMVFGMGNPVSRFRSQLESAAKESLGD